MHSETPDAANWSAFEYHRIAFEHHLIAVENHEHFENHSWKVVDHVVKRNWANTGYTNARSVFGSLCLEQLCLVVIEGMGPDWIPSRVILHQTDYLDEAANRYDLEF